MKSHRVRQQLLDEFDGDVDALTDEANRRLLNGEFADFGIVTRTREPSQTAANGTK